MVDPDLRGQLLRIAQQRNGELYLLYLNQTYREVQTKNKRLKFMTSLNFAVGKPDEQIYLRQIPLGWLTFMDIVVQSITVQR